MNTYLKLHAFAKPYARYIIPYLICGVLGTLFGVINIGMLIPLLDILFGSASGEAARMTTLPEFSFSADTIKAYFDYYFYQVVDQRGPGGALLVVCILTATSVFLSVAFSYLAIYIMESLRARTIRIIRESMFDKVINLHLGYFTEARKGDIMSRITSDIYLLEASLTKSFFILVKEPITLIIFFGVLFAASVKLTLFTLILIPIAGITISTITRKLRQYSSRGQIAIGQIANILDEAIGGFRVVKAFNAVNYVKQKFNYQNDYYAKQYRKMQSAGELAGPVSEFLGVITVVIILLYGGSLVLSNQFTLSPSEFIAYIALFTQVMKPVKAISVEISGIQKGIAAGERVMTILEAENKITNKQGATELKGFERKIEFRNVDFAYEEKPVLKNLTYEIQKGSMVALVGESGGGKSTIADLIPRFYDVTSGSILIDGVDIRDLTVESLRSQMGIVTQESILFNDTIFNNIAFANPEATQETVERAARIANAHNFIVQTPGGYQTVIGERGTKLSGGQRQRISIARAILKNPPILILDEATSALDTESEKLVQEAITELMKNRTSLVIAHRLSTIQNADQILVIEEGEIVEQGSHEDLINRDKGVYRKLKEMQEIG